MGKYILSIIFFLITASQSFGQIGNWVPRAAFGGIARQYAVGFSINNKGYIGTGWDMSSYRDDFWEYDPATNSWLQRANFGGGARILAVGFAIGSKGYIGTGQDFVGRLNDFWEYTPTTNTWLQKASFGGAARTRAVGMCIGTKGYIGTGYDDFTNTYFSDFWEFDPAANTWTRKAIVGGGGRREAVAFSIGNRGYVGTGFDGVQYKKDIWQYNPVNDTWLQKASIGTAQWFAIAFTIGRKGYVGVGYGLSSPLKEFWDYDTIANKWTRNRDFGSTARFGAAGFAIGLKGYVGTGFDINNQKMKDFWEFQPAYIVTGKLPISRLCVSTTDSIPVSVPYSISISFNPGNAFTAQLSDSAGNFGSPIKIGTRTDTLAGTISAKIPPNILHGYKYRIRVISSNPPFIGSENTTNIIINPNPNVGIKINDTLQCMTGNLFNFEDTSTISMGRDTLTQWYFGDGGISSGTITDHSYAIDGIYSVKMRTVSDSGCADSIIQQVTVLPGPKTSFTASDTVQCLGGNKFTFTNTTTSSSGFITYKWFTGNGDSFSTTDLIYSYPKFGSYKLRLYATSDKGCVDSAFKTIRVDSAAVVDFVMSSAIVCAGTPVIFTNITSGSQTFVWDFGDGNTFKGKDTTHVYNTDGTYDVKLAGYSAQCSDSTTKKVDIIPKPTPDYTVNLNPQNLIGNNFIFTNTSTVKTGTFSSYWQFDDGDTSTQNNPSHSYLALNNYFVKLIVTATNGCKDSVIKKMTVSNSKFTVDFTSSILCYGDSTYFINTSTISNDSFENFLWNYGDGKDAIVKYNPKHLYPDTGTYIVKMTGLTKLGYKDSVSYIIRILSKPSLTITASSIPPYIKGTKVTLTANGVFDSILWSTGAIISSIDVDSSGTFTVRVVSANGCDTVGSTTLEFIKGNVFTAPNTITPNGDGYNDLWVIPNIAQYQPCKLAIFNRWGDELYNSSDYKNNWDGKFKGKPLPEASYYYILEAKGGKVYTGVLNVIQ